MKKDIMDFPSEIRQILEQKGVIFDEVLFKCRADMGLEMEYADTWISVSETEVCILETLGGIFEKKKEGFHLRKSEVGIAERSFRVFERDEWERFRIEEFVSGGRVVATSKKENLDAVVFNFSNKHKNDAASFCRFLSGEKTKAPDFAPPKDMPPPDMKGPMGPRGMRGGKSLKELDALGLIKKMLPFFKRYKFKTLTVLVMVILSSALAVFSPFLSGEFFYDEVLDIGGDFYGEILFAIILVAGVKLISVVFMMLHSIITAKISANVIYDLKKTIFSAVQRLSMGYFTMRQSGGIMTQINQDSNSIYWFFVDGIPYFTTNLVQLISITVILFLMNWKLTLVVVIPIPVFLFFRGKFMRLIRKYHAKTYSKRRSFNGFVSDILEGSRVVKAFSREELEKKKFNYKSFALADTNYETVCKSNWLSNIIPSLLQTATWAVWAVGGILVFKSNLTGGSFTYGSLVTYIAMQTMLYASIEFFNGFSRQLSECLNAMYRLFEILEKKSEVPESENPTLPEKSLGEIEFRNVSFEYTPNHKVIDNVSFKASAGETIGIVGHTGAGKSTLASLMLRLYDATEGQVKIDGVDVKELPTKYIRDSISIVSQDTYVFAGTIADNIRYGVPEASLEEVVEAAKIAGAHDFIIKYPDGYNTKIGTGFKSLSGGELQRVSIARAILKDPKILILDEATSAMDTATEQRIQRAITEITKNKTTIIIAHRLSTLRDADRLIVIENGKMSETGTHTELVKKKGSYYKLYKMQLDALRIIGLEE